MRVEVIVYKGIKFDDTRIPSAWQIGDTIGRTLACIRNGVSSLHREIWKTISGRSPMVTTSTIDGNPDNNDIENLECLPAGDHLSYHGNQPPSDRRLAHLEEIRDAATERHRSMLAANGIASMADAHGKAVYRLSANASNAVAKHRFHAP